MRNNKKYPKFNSTEILKIAGRPGYGHTGIENIVLAGLFERPVPMKRHLCKSCRFIGEWIEKRRIYKN